MTRRNSSQHKSSGELSRRERQLMDALYRLGRASASDIHAALTDPPSYTAVRTHLTLLEARGLVRHKADGLRYIYEPVVPREDMGQTAIRGVLSTFFDNSVEKVVAALISREDQKLPAETLDRLASLIDQARKTDKGGP